MPSNVWFAQTEFVFLQHLQFRNAFTRKQLFSHVSPLKINLQLSYLKNTEIDILYGHNLAASRVANVLMLPSDYLRKWWARKAECKLVS